MSKSELQRRFNDGRFVERAINEGLTCCRRDLRNVRFPDVDGDIEAATIAWRDAGGRLRFYAQCFRLDGGNFAPRTSLDPKLLLDDDGVYYTLDE